MDMVEIEVVNWLKYNPARKDVNESSWFRMQVNFCLSPSVVRLNSDQKVLLVCLMGECGRAKAERIVFDKKSFAQLLKIRRPNLNKALEVLEKGGLIVTARARNADVTHTNIQTYKQTHKQTDEQTGIESFGRAERPSPRQLAELWNKVSPPAYPKVDLSKLVSGSGRYQHSTARLSGHPDLGYWEQVITRIGTSSFCSGQNDRGWIADFDFMIRRDTHLKVLEGKYDDRDAPTATSWMDTWKPPEEVGQ